MIKDEMQDPNSKFKMLQSDQNLLCPVGLESLTIRGDFGADNFDFVKISVIGCDLGPDLCFTDAEIAKKTFNLPMLKAFPSLYGDEEDRSQVIRYTEDDTHFYYFDPSHT